MPKIYVIGSIEIWIYFFDTKKHKSPHFHAVSPDGEMVVEIASLEKLAKNMKVKQQKKVLDWAGSEEAAQLLKDSWNECNPQQVMED